MLVVPLPGGWLIEDNSQQSVWQQRIPHDMVLLCHWLSRPHEPRLAYQSIPMMGTLSDLPELVSTISCNRRLSTGHALVSVTRFQNVRPWS